MVDREVLLKILEAGESTPAVPVGERCRSLRCKGMYLNYGLSDVDRVAGDGNFWCAKTQRVFGPDDNLVGDGECRHSGRACFEGT